MKHSTLHAELHALYGEWRRLTDLETEAIQAGDWPRVDEQQSRKQSLQARIASTAGAVRLEIQAHGGAPADFEAEFRPVVDDLVALELANRERLCQRREELQGERRANRQTAARLRGLQRSYAQGPVSRWESWS